MLTNLLQKITGGTQSPVDKDISKDSCREESSNAKTTSPRLPLPVLVRIAEHLISQFAFKTAASLNRVSKILRSETLPVLYETFFYDDFKNLRRNQQKSVPALPAAVKKYTKYIFYTTMHEKAKEFERLKEFPKVVMTICVDDFGTLKEPDVATIRLYKPVSAATAFTIIETPFRQDSLARGRMAHDLCTSSQHLMSLMQLSGLLGGGEPARMPFTDIPMAEDCVELTKRPLVRPVSNIRKVVLVKGAHLNDNYPTRLSAVRSDLRLHNLEFEVDHKGKTSQDLTATYIEFMKVAGMQRDEKTLFEAEQKLIPEHGFGNVAFGSSTCMLKLGYTEWHMNLVMTYAETEAFVERLKVEAQARPAMLLIRLQITIQQDAAVDYDEMTSLLRSIRQIYASHITGKHQVLPTRSDPPELVRCLAISKMSCSPALAKETGWMSTSEHSVLPLVATLLTGSIKVVTKKRGVNITVELHKQQKFPNGPPKAFENCMKLVA